MTPAKIHSRMRRRRHDLLTGIPHGVGMAQKPPRWLKVGDNVTIEIEKIGALQNPVANET
jgi:2-keto-4-pentenoate hydratase/2-oxohepta-3-ene-1,7-dioic acid hydratase in catechol pathway